MLSAALRSTIPAATARATLTANAAISSNALTTAGKAIATQFANAPSMRAPQTQQRLASVLTPNNATTGDANNRTAFKNSQTRHLSQSAFAEATQHLKTPSANAQHPRYAVSSNKNSDTSKFDSNTRLFNHKILLSPFKKGLDTVQALSLTKSDNDGNDAPENKQAQITENLNEIFNTLSTPEEKAELLQTLEFQLLGPQAELGSGKVAAPECALQLKYDCYQVLAAHDMSFSDLDAVIGALQAQRGNTGDTQLQGYATAAVQAPWPTTPTDSKLNFGDFKMQATQATQATTEALLTKT